MAEQPRRRIPPYLGQSLNRTSQPRLVAHQRHQITPQGRNAAWNHVRYANVITRSFEGKKGKTREITGLIHNYLIYNGFYQCGKYVCLQMFMICSLRKPQFPANALETAPRIVRHSRNFPKFDASLNCFARGAALKGSVSGERLQNQHVQGGISPGVCHPGILEHSRIRHDQGLPLPQSTPGNGAAGFQHATGMLSRVFP